MTMMKTIPFPSTLLFVIGITTCLGASGPGGSIMRPPQTLPGKPTEPTPHVHEMPGEMTVPRVLREWREWNPDGKKNPRAEWEEGSELQVLGYPERDWIDGKILKIQANIKNIRLDQGYPLFWKGDLIERIRDGKPGIVHLMGARFKKGDTVTSREELPHHSYNELNVSAGVKGEVTKLGKGTIEVVFEGNRRMNVSRNQIEVSYNKKYALVEYGDGKAFEALADIRHPDQLFIEYKRPGEESGEIIMERLDENLRPTQPRNQDEEKYDVVVTDLEEEEEQQIDEREVREYDDLLKQSDADDKSSSTDEEQVSVDVDLAEIELTKDCEVLCWFKDNKFHESKIGKFVKNADDEKCVISTGGQEFLMMNGDKINWEEWSYAEGTFKKQDGTLMEHVFFKWAKPQFRSGEELDWWNDDREVQVYDKIMIKTKKGKSSRFRLSSSKTTPIKCHHYRKGSVVDKGNSDKTYLLLDDGTTITCDNGKWWVPMEDDIQYGFVTKIISREPTLKVVVRVNIKSLESEDIEFELDINNENLDYWSHSKWEPVRLLNQVTEDTYNIQLRYNNTDETAFDERVVAFDKLRHSINCFRESEISDPVLRYWYAVGRKNPVFEIGGLGYFKEPKSGETLVCTVMEMDAANRPTKVLVLTWGNRGIVTAGTVITGKPVEHVGMVCTIEADIIRRCNNFVNRSLIMRQPFAKILKRPNTEDEEGENAGWIEHDRFFECDFVHGNLVPNDFDNFQRCDTCIMKNGTNFHSDNNMQNYECEQYGYLIKRYMPAAKSDVNSLKIDDFVEILKGPFANRKGRVLSMDVANQCATLEMLPEIGHADKEYWKVPTHALKVIDYTNQFAILRHKQAIKAEIPYDKMLTLYKNEALVEPKSMEQAYDFRKFIPFIYVEPRESVLTVFNPDRDYHGRWHTVDEEDFSTSSSAFVYVSERNIRPGYENQKLWEQDINGKKETQLTKVPE